MGIRPPLIGQHKNMKTPRPTSRRSQFRGQLAVAAGVSAVCLGLLTLASPAQAQVTAGQFSKPGQDLAAYSKAADHSYWTMAPGNNCTNYVAWRLIQNGMSPKITWLHNGGDWAGEARSHHIPVDHVASVGAVAQWAPGAPSAGSSGHVAYVEVVDAKSITVSEDNYPNGPRRLRVIQKGSPEWPTNFIHFAPTSSARHGSPAANSTEWQQLVKYYERTFR